MRNNPEVRQQMFEMVERWKQSGLAQRTFCEQHSLKFHTFYYWLKQHKQQDSINNNQSGFVKLQITKPATASSVEIHFPGGLRLIFHEPVSSSYLKSLIS